MARKKRKTAKKTPVKPARKPVHKPAGGPAKKLAKKPAKTAARKTPAGKSAKKPVKKTVKKVAKNIAGKTAKKLSGKVSGKAAGVTVGKAAKKSLKKAPLKKKPLKKKIEKTARKIVRKAVRKTGADRKTGQESGQKSGAPTLPRLLGRLEPAPFRIDNENGRANVLVVCDHASNAVPHALNNLGLSRAERALHVAWDPGTADIGKIVSRALDATVIYANYSRLVVDLNRGEDSPECMREISDHVRVPANEGLSAEDRQQRLDEIFHPYHAQIKAQLDRLCAGGATPVLISIHSFTPEMDGVKRPWEIGVLWNRDEKISRRLVDSLRRDNPGLTIGENEPYSLKDENVTRNTISTHAEPRGLPYLILEFRQDLVGTRSGARKWADIFLKSLLPILADPATYQPRKKPVAKKAKKKSRRA